MISSPSRPATRVTVARITAFLAALTAPILVLGLLVAGPATAAVATGDRAGSSTSSQTAAGDRKADERDRKKAEKERAKAQKAAAKAEKRDQKAAERDQKAAERDQKAAEREQKSAAKAEEREQKASAKAEERDKKAAEREQKAAAKAEEREQKAAVKAAEREQKAAAKAEEREQETADKDDVAGPAADDSPPASPAGEPTDAGADAAGMSAAGSTELQRSSVVLAPRRAGCVDGLAVLQGQCSLNSSLDTNAGPQASGQAQPPAAAVRKPAAAAQSEPKQAQGWSRVTTGVTDLASALPQTGAAAWLTYGAAAGVLLFAGGLMLMRRRTRS